MLLVAGTLWADGLFGEEERRPGGGFGEGIGGNRTSLSLLFPGCKERGSADEGFGMTRVEIERRPTSERRPGGEFLCGAAEFDITPPIGMPLAGFSAEGEVARGIRGHLFARVLYLPSDGQRDR